MFEKELDILFSIYKKIINMKILNFLKNAGLYILGILKSQIIIVVAALIGVVVGLIWGVTIGFFTFFGLGLGYIVYIFLRQMWWWITKSGDYESNDSKK